MNKVLMDGGSSINILYYDTLKRMQLQDRQLIPTEIVFHGIVPGKSAKPIGKIYLEVAFGTVENFRSEIMSFEVVDLKSPYHALFGRPAYFKFMARPCYVYLKLKMPGPAGVITVNGSKQMALECELGDAAMAETACAQEEFKFYKANIDPEDNSVLNRPGHGKPGPVGPPRPGPKFQGLGLCF